MLGVVVVLLIVGVVAVFGSLAGIAVRQARLRGLRKADVQKPLYTISDDLTPAEFGVIVDGAIGRKELVAEIILLAMRGQVVLNKLPSGSFRVVPVFSAIKDVTPIQGAILATLGQENAALLALPLTVEYETKRSLRSKGWIVDKKPPLRGLSDVPPTYTRITLIAAAIIVVLAIMGTKLGGGSGILVYTVVVLTALAAEAVIISIVGLLIVFHGEMAHNAQFMLAASTKYAQQWKNVYGVYQYIRISGMDIFTPNYDTMDFSGLDPLYPFAVAAGLDKKIVKLIKV